ncbi:hypothetical protein C1645_878980 [Glomus cerebriforme]|uniref:Uncharacterized protein n=1 Tax=Glomus cerebriforme TaxID=658196 RepID=A0A397SIG0_9GLOM|nr:hypothetical protein C1645_878980 [Glomus cerebriforme]
MIQSKNGQKQRQRFRHYPRNLHMNVLIFPEFIVDVPNFRVICIWVGIHLVSLY